ncbi:hypothetical protein LCGC14_0646600 [marine sediment metagenome]|uniref:Uncharacterized protein n=1 Tax=marine sediment metagenome TaxID=412755 RepID=A0A0F9TJ84_9ZZZZ|nr:MAG: hypothetical protein Lokiarch_14640 [Candidatus Lokiarchaeum sp. GC14_75]HEC36850.1 hypothetical protein [bacterium]
MRVRSITGVIFYTIMVLSLIILLVFLFLSYNCPVFVSMRDIFKISLPIYASLVIGLISSTYGHFFRRPWLALDLENSRHYLIDEFDLEENNQTSGVKIKLGDTVSARAKYIRVNLLNNGKETAKNCRIKLHIYYANHELVREPSNLYPSGYHQFKKDRKPPPFIDIAAGDSQIFDICSTTNIYIQHNIVRFEDYFNYSRIESKNNPLSLNGIKEFYIKLFVYSDNNDAFEEQYKIFKKEGNNTDEWRNIDMTEFEWEKKKIEIRTNSQNPEINEDIQLTKTDEAKSPNEEYLHNDNSQKSNNKIYEFDENLKGDHTTGL